MDDLKDNEGGPLKDNKDNSLIKGDQAFIRMEEGLFLSSQKDLYVYRKTEKICSAIHYVTNFINEKEPIRLALRDKSSSILSLYLEPYSISISLVELRSILKVAFFSGLISDMNFNIIKSEIEQLLFKIEAKRQNLFVLSSSFMNVPLVQKTEESKGHIENRYIGQTVPKKEIHRPQVLNTSSNQSDRTIKILNLLKDGKELTIKDFSIIKGCSEKTLQRELLKLVAEGKILKRGERRWSRYSL